MVSAITAIVVLSEGEMPALPSRLISPDSVERS